MEITKTIEDLTTENKSLKKQQVDDVKTKLEMLGETWLLDNTIAKYIVANILMRVV